MGVNVILFSAFVLITNPCLPIKPKKPSFLNGLLQQHDHLSLNKPPLSVPLHERFGFTGIDFLIIFIFTESL